MSTGLIINTNGCICTKLLYFFSKMQIGYITKDLYTNFMGLSNSFFRTSPLASTP